MSSNDIQRLAENIAKLRTYTARELGADRFKKYDGRHRASRVFLVNAKHRKLLVNALHTLANSEPG